MLFKGINFSKPFQSFILKLLSYLKKKNHRPNDFLFDILRSVKFFNRLGKPFFKVFLKCSEN